ncbi:MAG TPA: ABC-F family ATP-binding cassette domain-containing protein [Gemmataceae bacterium]|nr:ABC-F family ATP-binding cassette domain-containing protein [Gemmataceae bacterium]
MLLLSCTNLTRGYDRGPLFEDVSFELYHGERVGLVGPNGAGKSTLLRILAGKDTPDKGDIRFHAGARGLLLEQDAEIAQGRTLFEEAKSAFAELLTAQEEMVRTAEELANAKTEVERKALAARYDRLNELLRHNDAYTVDHKVEEVLHGLGFRKEDYGRALETFSGGQQRRLLLAKLLLSSPDILLLDEPSNHLDIGATRWLESYLVQQPQAMLIVSHDRYFLDKVTTKIFELQAKKITAYPGNYKQYLRLRQERYEVELKNWEAQQEYIEKQEEYIRRVHYGQLAKQAQSRRKALERLERVDKPTLVQAPSMHFDEVVRSGDVVFEAHDLGMAYDRPLFEHLNFSLPRGKRLGIMGPNGSGKTTLLKILLGEIEPTAGEVKRGHLVDPGYLDQHLQMLPEDKQVIRAVWPYPDPEIDEKKMRDLLGRFGLSGDIVFQNVGELSGGERSRVALARLVALGVNVLILDEPTNHLDIWACEALEQALLEYEGTLIVVSHDRYFLNRVVDLLIVLEDGHAQVIHGNYDTYELFRATRQIAEHKAPGQPREQAPARASNKPAKRKRKFAYRKVEELEADIATHESRLLEMESALASAELYRDPPKLKETMQSFEDTKVKLQQLYEHWEEAVELN